MKISHFPNKETENHHIFQRKVQIYSFITLPPVLSPFCNYPNHPAGDGGGF